MTHDPETLRRLAAVLEYPRPGFAARVADCAERLSADHARAAARLARFAVWALGASEAAIEEAYTAAFDLAPLCSPYVGDLLFGATRERSYFLSGLRELQREVGLEPGRELPDHVAEVLRLVAAPIPDDVRDDLVRDGLAPALKKMHAALCAAGHPWADALAAAADAVDVPVLEAEATP